jgi:hypothetical protein
MCVGVLFLVVGVIISTQGGGRATEVSEVEKDEARWVKTPPGPTARRSARPTPLAPSRRTPPAVQPRKGDTMQAHFFNARLGQTFTYNHPLRGAQTGTIIGSIQYTELWQRRNAPTEPWVPTGNTFAAHWTGATLLYEWQQRLYLLDEQQPLTDQEINASFLPYAKRFAQSDQTAQVVFAWPPASWTIVDIGRFEVARAVGEGLRLNQGAIGRFIHARGADQRALVVEDYQEGQGGQDTAWIGYAIEWKDLLKLE